METDFDKRIAVVNAVFTCLSSCNELKDLNIYQHLSKIPVDKFPALIIADGESDFDNNIDPIEVSLYFTIVVAIQEGKYSVSVVRDRMKSIIDCLLSNKCNIIDNSETLNFSIEKTDIDLTQLNKVWAGGYIYVKFTYFSKDC